MSPQRKRPQDTTAKEAETLKKRLLKDEGYLAELDEAFEEFKKGKGKTLEEIEIARQQRKLQSGR